MASLTDRQQRALTLRNEGKTFRAIGADLGVSVQRAREIVMHAQERSRVDGDTIQALSVRAYNCLRNMGFDLLATRADVAPHLDALRQGARPIVGYRFKNFGKVSLREVEAWLKAAEPR